MTKQEIIKRIERLPSKRIQEPLSHKIQNYTASREYIPKKLVLAILKEEL